MAQEEAELNPELNPDEWHHAKGLFATLRELDATEWEEYLSNTPYPPQVVRFTRELLAEFEAFDCSSKFLSPPELAPTPPRQLVRRYDLAHVLGEGGMGTVYHAHDRLYRRDVAVKILRGLAARREDRVRSEVSALRRLRIPGVVELYDDGVEPFEDGTVVFIVTELLSGSPFPGQREPAWSELLPTLVSLLETLARVHCAGFLHRDLKPSNVLVEQGRPTVLDLGIAIQTEDPEETQAWAGTPRFMAPELSDKERYSAACDLYSCGVMVFEALARCPFDRDSTPPQRQQQLTDNGVPQSAIRWIERLYAADPQQRFASAEEALRAIGVDALGIDQVEHLVAAVVARHQVDEFLTEEQLRELFAGPDVVFHQQQDSAAELWGRTAGEVNRVVIELSAWHRAGLTSWDDGRLWIDAHPLDQLRAGLQVSTPPPCPDGLLKDSEEQRLLALLTLIPEGATVEQLESWATIARPALPLSRLEARRLAWTSAPGTWRPRAIYSLSSILSDTQQLQPFVESLPTSSPLSWRVRSRLGLLDRQGAKDLFQLAQAIESHSLLLAFSLLLESVRSARRQADGDTERMTLNSLFRLAIRLGTHQILERCLYELEISPRFSPIDAQRGELLRLTLLCNEGSWEQCLLQLPAPPDLPEDQSWHYALQAFAARRVDKAVEQRAIANLRRLAKVYPGGSPAYYHTRGNSRYYHGDFLGALRWHRAAVDSARDEDFKLHETSYVAMALLELGEFESALQVTEDAIPMAIERRATSIEWRLRRLARDCVYRLGRSEQVDFDLLAVARKFPGENPSGIVFLTEAAVAWRQSDTHLCCALCEEGKAIAGTAARGWSFIFDALAYNSREEVDPEDLSQLRQRIRKGHPPGVQLQAIGLISKFHAPLSEEEKSIVLSWAHHVPTELWNLRREVSSVAEALQQALFREARE